MDPTEFSIHLALGRHYGQEATCGRKVDYKSDVSANRAASAMMDKGSKDLEGYPCVWCEGWHIGRAMTEEEMRMGYGLTLRP